MSSSTLSITPWCVESTIRNVNYKFSLANEPNCTAAIILKTVNLINSSKHFRWRCVLTSFNYSWVAIEVFSEVRMQICDNQFVTHDVLEFIWVYIDCNSGWGMERNQSRSSLSSSSSSTARSSKSKAMRSLTILFGFFGAGFGGVIFANLARVHSMSIFQSSRIKATYWIWSWGAPESVLWFRRRDANRLARQRLCELTSLAWRRNQPQSK